MKCWWLSSTAIRADHTSSAACGVRPTRPRPTTANPPRTTGASSCHVAEPLSSWMTPRKEKIEVIDKDGERKVILDSANRKIQVLCDTGDVEVKAGAGSVKVEATTVEISATGNMTLDAKGTMTIKGQLVLIN